MSTMLNTLSWSYVAPIVASQAIPYISGLATKLPDAWRGLATLVLSAAAAFFGEWAKQGSSFDVKTALLVTVVVTGLAFLQHKQVISGTDLEKWLNTHGNTPKMTADDRSIAAAAGEQRKADTKVEQLTPTGDIALLRDAVTHRRDADDTLLELLRVRAAAS